MPVAMNGRWPRSFLVGAVLLVVVLVPRVLLAASAGGGADMPWTGPLRASSTT